MNKLTSWVQWWKKIGKVTVKLQRITFHQNVCKFKEKQFSNSTDSWRTVTSFSANKWKLELFVNSFWQLETTLHRRKQDFYRLESTTTGLLLTLFASRLVENSYETSNHVAQRAHFLSRFVRNPYSWYPASRVSFPWREGGRGRRLCQPLRYSLICRSSRKADESDRFRTCLSSSKVVRIHRAKSCWHFLCRRNIVTNNNMAVKYKLSSKDFQKAVDSALSKVNVGQVSSLTGPQSKAMYCFLGGHDTFVSLPTGHGKSMIYQLCPVVAKELAAMDGQLPAEPMLFVVSLNSLIADQLMACETMGIPVCKLDADSATSLQKACQFQLLYASPEVIDHEEARKLLQKYSDCIIGVVTDESHSIVQW